MSWPTVTLYTVTLYTGVWNIKNSTNVRIQNCHRWIRASKSTQITEFLLLFFFFFFLIQLMLGPWLFHLIPSSLQQEVMWEK